VSRIRTILHKLVSLCQLAFIPGRYIAKNEIIVHEILYSFKLRRVKDGLMAVKLDLQKAYNRINWSFLRNVLQKFGFADVFINWIMECISTVSSAIIINEGKFGMFKHSRGLRQGDPLSSYLFILCQEVLLRMLDREFSEGRLSGVETSLSDLTLIHVMYVDDIVLFTKADNRETTRLNECLDLYCSQSGQAINRAKSGIAFSKATTKPAMRSVKQVLQMKKLQQDAKYLGAPRFLSRAPSKDFNFLQEKLEIKLRGWRSKCLSWAGRCTLIKILAQAIPSHTMSTFEVPSKTYDKLDYLVIRFWWCPSKSNRRYMVAKSWKNLCKHKKEGGLGFRKSKEFNYTLLSKIAWMIASGRDSVCMSLLRSKYKVRTKLLG
jgi:hypothetical protein